MSEINVSSGCINCGLCVKVCPMKIFALQNGTAWPQNNPASCIRCGHCIANCPVNAITVKGLSLESDTSCEKPCNYLDLRGLVRCRRSVRLYLDKTVPKSDFEELLATARYAPTARNSQGVYWTVVMDPAKVQKLSALTVDWFQEKKILNLVEQWKNGYDIICRHAPHLVLVHSDDNTAKPVEDAAIALTTFELLANAKGLGTCWAGFLMTAAYDYAPLHAALELPAGHKVRGALMVGYSAVRPQHVPVRDTAKVTFI